MSVASRLKDQVVQTHATTATADVLKTLNIRLDMFFASRTAHELLKEDQIWSGYVTEEGRPVANVRIATFDFGALVGKGAATLLRMSDDHATKAGAGDGASFEQSAHPPIEKFHAAIKTDLVTYLRSLFGHELAEVAETTQAALDLGPPDHYRGVVTVDYYSDRATATSNLHKDTVGATLFVVLHYLNPERMLGPEYVHDKWPIPSGTQGAKHYFQPGPEVGDERRFHAPWRRNPSKVGDYYWPEELLKQLEEARGQLRDDRTLHAVNLEPFGLISFVDELIYHATPIRRSRTQEIGLFSKVKLERKARDILPPKLERRMSFDLKNSVEIPSETGGATRRSFLRLWVSIVPKDWYTPLALG